MASKETQTATSTSLGKAATQFLLKLPSEERPKAQQEIYRFARWYGEERSIGQLSIPEVANYADQSASSAAEAAQKLAIVKKFLNHSYKQGLTTVNLAVHLKAKKTTARVSVSPRRSPEEPVVLTTQGHAELQAELTNLKDRRPHIAEELRRAAADKDFRENAPYAAAKETQGHVEARIKELEATLRRATILEEKQSSTHQVTVGDTVLLLDPASGDETEYTLVDASEANPAERKISMVSPVGKALLGQETGNQVEVRAPGGVLHYKIKDICPH